MTYKRFNEVVQNQIKHCTDLLITKGEEYVKTEDRLANFKKAAVLQDETPKEALFGMLTKHLVSLSDMCMWETPVTKEPLERWCEKITDSINYLILLRALIEEEAENEKD